MSIYLFSMYFLIVFALFIEVNLSSCSLTLTFLFTSPVKNKNALEVFLPTDISEQDNFNRIE